MEGNSLTGIDVLTDNQDNMSLFCFFGFFSRKLVNNKIYFFLKRSMFTGKA